METSKEDICNLMDKLSLRMLELMEEEVRRKLAVERAMKNGEILLAKTRFQTGSQSVSQLQLPTEDSKEFCALTTVAKESDQLSLEEHTVDKESGRIDPLKWFGILTPRSLAFAARNFRKATLASVDCANTHIELNQTIAALNGLKQMKEGKSRDDFSEGSKAELVN